MVGYSVYCVHISDVLMRGYYYWYYYQMRDFSTMKRSESVFFWFFFHHNRANRLRGFSVALEASVLISDGKIERTNFLLALFRNLILSPGDPGSDHAKERLNCSFSSE